MFVKKTPEFLVQSDFQHVWLKSGHFERAVNKIDTLDGTVVWCSKFKHNATGEGYPVIALSPKFLPMSVL